MSRRRRHIGTGRRILGGGALVAALVLGLASCGQSGPDSATDGGPATTAETAETAETIDLQLRPVLSSDPASIDDNPCPTDLPAPVPSEIVVSPGCRDGVIDLLYGLGPSVLDGSAFESARAVESQGMWVVNPVLKQGAEGIDTFNAIAANCYAKDGTCPSGQLAIVVDGVVISAPAIQTPSFEADQIQVSGDFTEVSAKALAGGIEAAS